MGFREDLRLPILSVTLAVFTCAINCTRTRLESGRWLPVLQFAGSDMGGACALSAYLIGHSLIAYRGTTHPIQPRSNCGGETGGTFGFVGWYLGYFDGWVACGE